MRFQHFDTNFNFGMAFIIEIANLEFHNYLQWLILNKNYQKIFHNKSIICWQKLDFFNHLAQFSLRLCDFCWNFVGFDGAHIYN